MALSSLRPLYHALVFTLDVSQWRGEHTIWPCSANILEHSGCSCGSVARDCPLPRQRAAPRHHRLGSGQRAAPRHHRLGSGLCRGTTSPRRWSSAAATLRQRGSSGRRSRATIPFSSMSQFMYFRESKPKFLFPQFLGSTMADITPTTSLIVELPETAENPTWYAP